MHLLFWFACVGARRTCRKAHICSLRMIFVGTTGHSHAPSVPSSTTFSEVEFVESAPPSASVFLDARTPPAADGVCESENSSSCFRTRSHRCTVIRYTRSTNSAALGLLSYSASQPCAAFITARTRKPTVQQFGNSMSDHLTESKQQQCP